jgi:sulfate transport system ATP-binding protein
VIGSTVRIELRRRDTNDLFEAEMSIEQYQKMSPVKKEDILYAEFKNIVEFNSENKTPQLGKSGIRNALKSKLI